MVKTKSSKKITTKKKTSQANLKKVTKATKKPTVKKKVLKVQPKKVVKKTTKSQTKKIVKNVTKPQKKQSTQKKKTAIKIKSKAVKKSPKTKLTVKKKVVKAKAIKKNTSQNDNVLEESFNLIKKLNTQVTSVEKVKKKLQEDIAQLGNRLQKHENSKTPKNLLNIKSELIREITPLVNNLNLKSMKVDVTKEIEKILELEIEKVKSEIDSKTQKINRNEKNRFAEIEVRLIESIKNQKLLEKQIKNLETAILQIGEESNSNTRSDEINLSAIESKVLKLQKDNQALHSLLEKYEDELYSRTKLEELEIEKKVKKTLSEATKKLEEVKKEQGAEEQFLVNKINEVIDYIENFELQVKNSQKTHDKNLDKKINEKFAEIKKSLSEKLSYAFKDKFSKTNTYLKDSINKFNDEKINIERNMELFKVEISSLIKNYILEIDKELKKIKSKENEYNDSMQEVLKNFNSQVSESLKFIEKDSKKEKEFLRDKLNEIIDVFNTLSVEQRKELNEIENKYAKQIQETISNEAQKAQEEIASQIIKNNSYLNELAINAKEKQKEINQNIEEKFIISKNQYDQEFKSHLLSFENELRQKESEFLDKLIVVEEEKTKMIQELDTFKQELSTLTKDYITKYDEELNKIKIEEANLKEEKKAFISQVDNVVNTRKIELSEYAKQYEIELLALIDDEKKRFVSNENAFKEIFKEKIENLHEYTKHRVDSLEKKFLEKNIKSIRERIDTDLKEVITVAQGVKASEESINKKLEGMEMKEAQLFANLESNRESMNKKIEKRMVDLEKQVNKRFLDLDSEFATYKATLIDEIESLIKEVGDLVQDKIETVDKLVTKLNFTAQEAHQKTSAIENLKSEIEIQVRDIRDEVRDIAVKTEVQGAPEIRTMNQLVAQMSDYEEQLVSLVESLLSRDVAHHSIITILVQKGHPRFYVQMIIDNIHKVRRHH